MEKKGRFIPVSLWKNYYDWPPIGGIRHLIANSAKKKCTHVFIKVAGKWIIDEEAFLEWVYSHRRT